MSDIIPPSEPDKEPPKPIPATTHDASEPPSKKLCTFLGFLLFVVSSGLAFVIPPICLLGFVAATASLFFKGYRCIFVGYILTGGLILLAIIAYCSTQPFDIK
jgi:hypothetical protein